jgi:hypothetical protein
LDVKQASPRGDFKQIVYVQFNASDPDTHTLYVTDTEENVKMDFATKPMTDIKQQINNDVKLLSSIELEGTLGRVRVR